MYKNYLKRILDLLISLFGLLLLLPLFFMVTIILYYTNSGSPFFVQSRPGINGKIFKIIKFKTMNDKKNINGNLCSDEIRLTKIGRIISGTRLTQNIRSKRGKTGGDVHHNIIGEQPLPNTCSRPKARIGLCITSRCQIDRECMRWQRGTQSNSSGRSTEQFSEAVLLFIHIFQFLPLFLMKPFF